MPLSAGLCGAAKFIPCWRLCLMRTHVVAAAAVFLTAAYIFPSENSVSPGSRADEAGRIFVLSPVTDGILLGAGASLVSADILFGNILKVKDTSFGGRMPDVSEVNGFDRIFMNRYSRPLDVAATVLEATSLALPAVMLAAPSSEWLSVGVMYAESLMMAYGLKELGKLVVSRARPYMYYDGYPAGLVESGDWNSSFPSGHTTMTFMSAAFTTYVFGKFFPGSAWRIPVTAAAWSLAAATGILRMASGNHFATDVLAGAAIGALSGLAVPLLHSLTARPLSGGGDKVSVSAAPGGVSVTVRL